MGRGRFTEEEMDRLLQNPYVADVNRTSISYSREFKQLFMREYTAGRRPVQIFRDAGFDIDMLGSKRIERACARWKESYESGTLGSREAFFQELCRRGIRLSPEGGEQEVICQIISDVAEKEECRNCVTHLCETAGISRSLYYQNKRRRDRGAQRMTGNLRDSGE